MRWCLTCSRTDRNTTCSTTEKSFNAGEHEMWKTLSLWSGSTRTWKLGGGKKRRTSNKIGKEVLSKKIGTKVMKKDLCKEAMSKKTGKEAMEKKDYA